MAVLISSPLGATAEKQTGLVTIIKRPLHFSYPEITLILVRFRSKPVVVSMSTEITVIHPPKSREMFYRDEKCNYQMRIHFRGVGQLKIKMFSMVQLQKYQFIH